MGVDGGGETSLQVQHKHHDSYAIVKSFVSLISAIVAGHTLRPVKSIARTTLSFTSNPNFVLASENDKRIKGRGAERGKRYR